MKKHSYLFSSSNLIFSIVYVILFVFSFLSILVTYDEYNGESPTAEFGTALFNFYGFPIFTVLETINLSFSTEYTGLFLTLFILNIIINYFLTGFLIHQLLKLIKRSFLRKSH